MRIVSILAIASTVFLVSCLQEDPQLQALRDERDAALRKVADLENSVTQASESSSGSAAENAALKTKMEDLQQQLEIARAEAKRAREAGPEILTEGELLIGLRVATEEHRRVIRERFEVKNIVLSDFSIPEELKFPYRCGVQYDLVDKKSGKPYHLDVNVRAPMSGEWEIPPVAEFADKIKEGARTASIAATGTSGGGETSGGSEGTVNPNTPISPGGFQVDRVTSLPGGGGGTSGNENGGQSTPLQNTGSTENTGSSSGTPEQELRGPGVGKTARKLRVDW